MNPRITEVRAAHGWPCDIEHDARLSREGHIHALLAEIERLEKELGIARDACRLANEAAMAKDAKIAYYCRTILQQVVPHVEYGL